MIKQKIFLLGGMDLEMSVIRDMLKEHNVVYYDNSPKWNNAVLSSYNDVLKKYHNKNNVIVYGIELTEDITAPENYIRIDHHNDFSHKPSSLQQTADLLDVEMSYFYKLVAANDVAYIPGMKQLGATEQDIIRIRTLDRKCQGVTDEDEAAAEKSIKENMRIHNGLTTVRSYTTSFSPICDRLYPYDSLLVYTDKEATYYGTKVCQLKNMFCDEIKAHKMYYGGNDGYFGIARDAYSKDELNTILNKIINLYE